VVVLIKSDWKNMKSLMNKTLMVLSFASLAACGSIPGVSDIGAMKTGIQVSQAQMDQVFDARTKQSDVVALVGQPNRKTQVGANTIWYYEFTQIGQAIIGKNINETTVFEFNNKGVVVAHYKTAGAANGNPLLKAAGLQ
jgi:outer membrane protein assembly factor BamE (lipoprotein component of BamABCDE complex)